jgi:hypothetical protein
MPDLITVNKFINLTHLKMKKCISPLAIIAVTVLLNSCSKETSMEASGVTNKVKMYTEAITSSTLGNSSATYNLEFDIAYRITSMISASDPRNKILFTYGQNYSYATDIYTENGFQLHSEVFLNRNLSTDSSFQYNKTGDSTTEKFFYNGTNLPAKSNEYVYSKNTGSILSNTITYSYDVKGNLVSAEGTDRNIETWEFYPDAVYIVPNIQPYYRKLTNNNLIKKHTVTSNGSLVGSTSYTYTFDSNHRISTETAVSIAGDIVVKTYTYF